MKYFKLVDGIAQLDKDEISLYSNVKKILSRDHGGKVVGDPDGRLKLYAHKEFTYVYFRCDFEAFPSQHGFSEKQAHEYAAKQAGLGEKFVPDDVLLAFCKQYEDEHLTQAKRTIRVLIRIFALSEKVLERIEKNVTELLERPTLTPEEIGNLLKYQNQLMNVASETPETVKKLRAAMNLLEQEDKVKEIGRGGFEITDSYNADNEIEN
jgi:hypothetical protein